MTLVWEHAPYSEGSLLVLLALADWADDSGVSWPSIPTLAEKARLQRRRVQYIIRKLESDGILDIEEGGGRNKQHRYALNLEKLKGALSAPYIEKAHEIKGAINAPFSGGGALGNMERVHFGAERVHSETQTVHSSAPDPLEEPLEDPPIEPSEASPPFSSASFTLALSDFFQNRKENKRKPYTPTGLRALYRDLGEWGETAATVALKDSVRGNWSGVFPPKVSDVQRSSNGNGQKPKGEYDPMTGELWVPKPFTWEDAAVRCPDLNPNDIKLHFEGKLEWKDVRHAA